MSDPRLEVFPGAGDWVITKAIAICLLGGAIVFAVLLCGCVAPDGQFVESMRAFYDRVEPSHRAYLDGDGSLDGDQRKRRHRTLDAADAAIRAAEKEIAAEEIE